MVVADIIRGALQELDLSYPKPDEKLEEVLRKARKRLAKE